MKLLRFVAGLLILTSIAGTACGGSSGSRVLLPTATIALTAAPASSPTAPFAPTATTLPATPAAGVSTCVSLNGLPDRNCTPGAIDPRVTQDNIQQTICVSGYTKTVRPSTSYTTPLKVRQMALYGWTGTTSDYEEDHLISLELGGNPTDEKNLWPEPYNIPNGARAKDKVENLLHAQVCAGQMTLADAQTLIATNWLAVGGGTTNPAQALPPSDSDDEDSPAAQGRRGRCSSYLSPRRCREAARRQWLCRRPPARRAASPSRTRAARAPLKGCIHNKPLPTAA